MCKDLPDIEQELRRVAHTLKVTGRHRATIGDPGFSKDLVEVRLVVLSDQGGEVPPPSVYVSEVTTA